ncbi:hypothetical protein T12_13547 [Trichinella patagoniensis]|uniref:Uncharacterized protein n=1 Tax=Trichinella patagoniensis TaxID=990121 RepID=A0A0V0ZLV2_9BILA|nr:hypothetical protein T12_13547 [Trichinella patagoniensis]
MKIFVTECLSYEREQVRMVSICPPKTAYKMFGSVSVDKTMTVHFSKHFWHRYVAHCPRYVKR